MFLQIFSVDYDAINYVDAALDASQDGWEDLLECTWGRQQTIWHTLVLENPIMRDKSCKVSAVPSQRDLKVALTKIQLGEHWSHRTQSWVLLVRARGTCLGWLLCWLLEDQHKGKFLPFSIWLPQGLKSRMRNLSSLCHLVLQGGVIPLTLLLAKIEAGVSAFGTLVWPCGQFSGGGQT